MRLFFTIIFSVIIFTIIALSDYARYKTLKKYYPEITYVDYLLLEDKLRIIPQNMD